MRNSVKGAAAAGAVILAAVGFSGASYLGGKETASLTPEPPQCENWAPTLTPGECFAAGTIRYVSLYNLQGAAQFCKWALANPGEWSRLKSAALIGEPASNIVTWMGGHIKNDLEAYDATGAPVFSIQPNTAPNKCGTPLAAPSVAGVTPGQTDATVTIG